MNLSSLERCSTKDSKDLDVNIIVLSIKIQEVETSSYVSKNESLGKAQNVSQAHP